MYSAIGTLYLLLTSVIGGTTPGRTYQPLQSERSNIVFLPYTPEQRQSVALGLQNMFAIYVHTEKKLIDLDVEYRAFSGQTIDPTVRVKGLVEKAANMTDLDFHYQFVDLFLSLRDFHTNYEMPGPHSCYGFVQAARYTVVELQNGWWSDFKSQWNHPTQWSQLGKSRTQLVVKSFTSSSEVLELSHEVGLIGVGDLVMKIDGLTFDEYLKAGKWEFGGANESGELRAGLDHLSARNGLLYKVPKADSVTYLMESYNTGKQYSVSLPWIASRKDACYDASVALLSNNFASIERFTKQDLKVKSIKENLNSMVNPNLAFVKEVFARDSKVVVNPTNDPIISWALYQKMGIIFIESFEPLNNDALRLVLLVRGLLVNELKDTESLLFDVRDNGGGLISMANLLPQLFGSYYHSAPARALVGPINQFIFRGPLSDPSDPWSKSYSKVQVNDRYTPLTFFDSDQDSNQIGGAYLKPVGVFTNGRCYSACDLFSAAMQDNNAAVVYGEDERTGAGGANVVEYTSYLSLVAKPYFPLFPYANFKFHQDARVGWRQSVRVLSHAGELIEDDGITSTFTTRPSRLDLIPATKSNSQYDFIREKLAEEAIRTGKSKRFFQASPQLGDDIELAIPVTIQVEVEGITLIKLSNANQTLLTQITLKGQREQRELRFDPLVRTPLIQRFTLELYSNEKLVFTTYRTYRFLPSTTSFYHIRSGPLPLSLQEKAVAQFDKHTQQGWVSNGTAIQILSYANNVDSTRSIFMNSQKQFNLTISLSYNIEFQFDFFRLSIAQRGKPARQLLTSQDSNGLNIDGISGPEGNLNTVDLVKTILVTEIGDLELAMQFQSDSAVSFTGVTINSILISS